MFKSLVVFASCYGMLEIGSGIDWMTAREVSSGALIANLLDRMSHASPIPLWVYPPAVSMLALLFGLTALLVARLLVGTNVERWLRHTLEIGVAPELSETSAHLQRLHQEVPRALLFLLAFGLVPWLGLLPGIVYLRLWPFGPLAPYLKGRQFTALRWVLRACNVSLVAVQPLPIVGPLTLPLLGVVQYGVYDAVVRQRARIDAAPVSGL